MPSLWRKRISKDDYNRLLRLQEGRCAICEKRPSAKRQLAIDHDHWKHYVRGLLCTNCNLGLGYFKDSRERFAKAAHYLHNAARRSHTPRGGWLPESPRGTK